MLSYLQMAELVRNRAAVEIFQLLNQYADRLLPSSAIQKAQVYLVSGRQAVA